MHIPSALRRIARRVPGARSLVHRTQARRLEAGPASFRVEVGADTPEPFPEPVEAFRLAPGRRLDELSDRIAEGHWFHTFAFVADGSDEQISTPGYDPTPGKANMFGLPADLSGSTVLDIGTYDGFFAFEAARRGAADVLATDHFSWTWPGETSRDNFLLVREFTGLPVREQTIPVEELSPEAIGGQFDIVLFYGVLYHAPDPLGYLRRVRSVTASYALIETVVDLLDIERPALAYYPDGWLNGDPSNHFGPNLAAVEGLCLDAGFSRIEHLTTWSPHLVEDLRGMPVPDGPPRSGRAVFRADV